MSFEYTACQKNAFTLLIDWWKNSTKQYFVLSGYAGSGKSSIVADLIRELAKSGRGSGQMSGDLSCLNAFMDIGGGSFSVKYVTFTGKASQVLRRKGLPATTVHQLIYKPHEVKGKVEFLLKPAYDLSGIDLIVVDEASMLSRDMYKDLLSYNIPIIFLGDLGQLPNTSDDGFNIMEEYNIFMRTITRQGLDSPIINLSMMAREGKHINNKVWGDGVMKAPISRISMDALLKADQVICGKNNTRIKINNLCRSHLDYDYSQYPVVGDKLLCRKNNYDRNLINGMVGTCTGDSYNIVPHAGSFNFNFESPEDNVNDTFTSSIRHIMPDAALGIMEINNAFDKEMDRFDFGYAITCHASQGSQYTYPIVIDEPFGTDEFKRKWRYTAITRAVTKLVILEGDIDQLVRKIELSRNKQ